ncbi:hypothetical protein ISF_04188 [Cordyceps fumosorosea ARSEF 2679]|uniref:P-loop containing nucleoside triphosphate hydrolase n=1 Tax=Cordyceps fumosorosea (strain ARSEF 2679) TaxID=1081104 RepID=A0A167XBU1_CORFA|nr:hypothetical protein ISF_04188 [Cordyceps fumosorosea ARSEF 2679]OAA64778.1 hypothetical protein ISF_04188 [Cordyceps fumosorosea ARSEF 2679]
MPDFLEANGDAAADEYARHMRLLPGNDGETKLDLANTPIFNATVRDQASRLSGSSAYRAFTQYGLLGGISYGRRGEVGVDAGQHAASDPRLFYNVATPSSVFICGSQGSGKSHSLSCLLENCLLPSDANKLPRPLTGIVFHYDTFNSDTGGSPSEAAYLSSNPNVQVRVLCAPTNRVNIQRIYSCLPNVVVSDFRIHESQLNTGRMLDLMAMGSVAGDSWPLYMHSVTRILREMRLEQQSHGVDGGFDYGDFKRRLTDEALIGTQLGPLQQRLDALESFMVPGEATQTRLRSGQGKYAEVGRFAQRAGPSADRTWVPKAGQLTIVDLSCPCITDVTACSLFTICLSLFLEQQSAVGRVVALDEAHKYMTGSIECDTLTERLLSAIRLQRHLATRVFISTQEPTISPKLLDLCSATIVHRFSSPEWLTTLKGHLAGASSLAGATTHDSSRDDKANNHVALVSPTLRSGTDSTSSDQLLSDIFQQIVSLRTGEALLFAPNAAIGVRMERAGLDSEDEGDAESASSESYSSDDSGSSADSAHSADESVLFNRDTANAPSARNAVRSAAVTDWRPTEAIRLGSGVMKILIRQRVTQDGGQSIMST